MSGPQNYEPGIGWAWDDNAFLPPLKGWAAKGHRLPTSTIKPSAAPSDPYTGLANAGFFLSVAGSLTGMVGSFYATKAQQSQLKSESDALDSERNISSINARRAENEAQSILEAGKFEIGMRGLQSAQEKGAAKAAAAGGGIQLGSGNDAEVQASIEFARQVDALTINQNTTRQANAARNRSVDLFNQTRALGVSSRNVRGTARSISPYAAATSSLLSTAGGLADRWVTNRRAQDRRYV